jgi:hypothetical protein
MSSVHEIPSREYQWQAKSLLAEAKFFEWDEQTMILRLGWAIENGGKSTPECEGECSEAQTAIAALERIKKIAGEVV